MSTNPYETYTEEVIVTPELIEEFVATSDYRGALGKEIADRVSHQDVHSEIAGKVGFQVNRKNNCSFVALCSDLNRTATETGLRDAMDSRECFVHILNIHKGRNPFENELSNWNPDSWGSGEWGVSCHLVQYDYEGREISGLSAENPRNISMKYIFEGGYMMGVPHTILPEVTDEIFSVMDKFLEKCDQNQTRMSDRKKVEVTAMVATLLDFVHYSSDGNGRSSEDWMVEMQRKLLGKNMSRTKFWSTDGIRGNDNHTSEREGAVKLFRKAFYEECKEKMGESGFDIGEIAAQNDSRDRGRIKRMALTNQAFENASKEIIFEYISSVKEYITSGSASTNEKTNTLLNVAGTLPKRPVSYSYTPIDQEFLEKINEINNNGNEIINQQRKVKRSIDEIVNPKLEDWQKLLEKINDVWTSQGEKIAILSAFFENTETLLENLSQKSDPVLGFVEKRIYESFFMYQQSGSIHYLNENERISFPPSDNLQYYRNDREQIIRNCTKKLEYSFLEVDEGTGLDGNPEFNFGGTSTQGFKYAFAYIFENEKLNIPEYIEAAKRISQETENFHDLVRGIRRFLFENSEKHPNAPYPKTLLESRFMPTEIQYELGVDSCGAKVNIATDMLRALGYNVKKVHGSVDNLTPHHAWLKVWNEGSKEWDSWDLTQEVMKTNPYHHEIADCYEWEEIEGVLVEASGLSSNKPENL